jgi:S1-C subfamily serine protease
LALKNAAKGDIGAVFGYPGGGDLAKSPYKVVLQKEVSMPDLYDQSGPTSNRNVLFLAARLQAGDSGSPLVNAEGRAIGVAFAISRKDANLAFALTVGDVKRVVDLARHQLVVRPDLNEPSTNCLPVEPVGTAASVGR